MLLRAAQKPKITRIPSPFITLPTQKQHYLTVAPSINSKLFQGYFRQHKNLTHSLSSLRSFRFKKTQTVLSISVFSTERKMNYEERLKAAARLILAEDSRAGDAPVDVAGFGITATLKPYQVEGVSWLIRRYNLGVNVILGTIISLSTFSLTPCLVAGKCWESKWKFWN